MRCIFSNAFANCTSLESVTLPATLTDIYGNPFYGCSSLVDIQVDAANGVYRGAGNCVIEMETKTLRIGCKATVIPADGSVRRIAQNAFAYCTELTYIEIPDSVEIIEGSAFYNCISLESIVLSDNVTSIGSWAFAECNSLTDVTIGSGVEGIAWGAFAWCENLTSITYTGTTAQWESIALYDGWAEGIGVNYVTCSDGIVYI